MNCINDGLRENRIRWKNAKNDRIIMNDTRKEKVLKTDARQNGKK